MSIQFTYDDVQKMFENSVQVANWRRNVRSSYFGDYQLSLTWAQIQVWNAQFYYNSGKLSDGTNVRIPGTAIYFRIPTTLDTWNPNRDTTPSIQSVQSRAQAGKKSLGIWINGIKIPDSEVLMYSTPYHNTDVFVPNSYLIQNANNSFFFETYENNTFNQVSGFVQNVPLQMVSVNIPFDMMILSNLESKYTSVNNGGTVNYNLIAMVYVNGVYIHPDNRQVSKIGNGISVFLIGETLITGNVEVVLDFSIVYEHNSITDKAITKEIFNIEETFQDPSLGSIPLYSCKFFVNGLRVPNNQVTQVGLLHYTTPVNQNFPGTILVTNSYLSSLKSPLYYGEDYFLYNMIGSDGVSNAIGGNFPNPNFIGSNGSVDFDVNGILNGDGTRWTEDSVNALISTYEAASSYESKIQLLLSTPNGYRNFLNLFPKNNQNYLVNYNGTDTTVYIGGAVVTPNQNAFYDININGAHVPSSLLTISLRGQNQIIGIPGYYFTKGNNIVSVQTWIDSERPINPIVVALSKLTATNGVYTFQIATPNGVLNPSDIVVIKQSVGDPTKMYVDPFFQTGYVSVAGYTVQINGSVTTITVPVSSVPDVSQVTVYSLKYVQLFSSMIQYTAGETVNSLIIPIYYGNPENPIPLLTTGKVVVYAGSTPLEEGVDYFFRSFLNNDQITYTAIVILNKYANFTNIDIYFTGVQNKIVWSLNGDYTDQYGLIYLGELPFPFDKSYMTINVNHSKLNDLDYDLISDRLIRVFNKPVPFQTITIETEFSEDYDTIMAFAGVWTPSDFEVAVSKLFLGVDYPTIASTVNPQFPNVDSIYSSFVQNVDSLNRAPNSFNAANDYYNNQRINLYVEAYLEWLLNSNQTKASIIIPGYWMSSTIMDKFSLYLQNITNNRDIVITDAQDLLQDVVTNQRNYPVTYGERIQFLAQWFQKYGGSFTQAYAAYINTPESNQLYEWDLVPLLDTDPSHAMPSGKDIVLGYSPSKPSPVAYPAVVVYEEIKGVASFGVFPVDPRTENSFDLSKIKKNSYFIANSQGSSDLVIHGGKIFVAPQILTMSSNYKPSPTVVSYDGNEFESFADGVGSFGPSPMQTSDYRNFIFREINETDDLLLASYSAASARSIFTPTNIQEDLSLFSNDVNEFGVLNLSSKEFKRKLVGNSQWNQAPILSASASKNNVVFLMMQLGGPPFPNETYYAVSDENGESPLWDLKTVFDTNVYRIISAILTTGSLYRRIVQLTNGKYAVNQTLLNTNSSRTQSVSDPYQADQIFLTKDGLIIRRILSSRNITVSDDLTSNTTILFSYPSIEATVNGVIQDSSTMFNYDIKNKQLIVTVSYAQGIQLYNAVVVYDFLSSTYKVFYGLSSTTRGLITQLERIDTTKYYDFTSMDIFTSLDSTNTVDVWGRSMGSGSLELLFQIPLVGNGFINDLKVSNNNIGSMVINSSASILILPSQYLILLNDGTNTSWMSYPSNKVLIDITRTLENEVYGVLQTPGASDGSIYAYNQASQTFEPVFFVDANENVKSVWSDHGGLFVFTISVTSLKSFIYKFDGLTNRIFKNQVNSIVDPSTNSTSNFGVNRFYKLFRSRNEFDIIELDGKGMYRSLDGMNFLSYNASSIPSSIPYPGFLVMVGVSLNGDAILWKRGPTWYNQQDTYTRSSAINSRTETLDGFTYWFRAFSTSFNPIQALVDPSRDTTLDIIY